MEDGTRAGSSCRVCHTAQEIPSNLVDSRLWGVAAARGKAAPATKGYV